MGFGVGVGVWMGLIVGVLGGNWWGGGLCNVGDGVGVENFSIVGYLL